MLICECLRFSKTVGSLKVQTSGEIADCNSKAALLFGLDRTALIGKTIFELTHPEDRPISHERFEAIRGGEIKESQATVKRYLSAEGVVRICSLEFIVRYEGNVPLYVESLMFEIEQASDPEVSKELELAKNQVESLMQIVAKLAARPAEQSQQDINIITGDRHNIAGNNDGGMNNE